VKNLPRKKLAYVAHYYPYIGGYGNRVISQLKFLSKYFDIYFYYFLKKNGDCIEISHLVKQERCVSGLTVSRSSSEMADLPGTIRTLGANRFFECMQNTLFKGMPFSISVFYSEKAKKALEEEIKHAEVDNIWAYWAAAGALCADIPAKKKVLDYCDSGYSLFSSFENEESRPIHKLLFALEKTLYRGFERRLSKSFARVAYISESDLKTSGIQCHGAIVLPNIRAVNAFPTAKKKGGLIMSGRWDYYPNKLALEFAKRDIFPLLKGISITVLGAGNCGKIGGAKYLGTVRHYSHAIANAKVFLAPIKCGAGIQNKVLDALEAGVPVVTSNFVKQEIDPAAECAAIIPCETPEEYAEKIIQLMGDSGKAAALGKIAMAFYTKKYAHAEKSYIMSLKWFVGDGAK